MIGRIRMHHLERCLLQPDEKKVGLLVKKSDFSRTVNLERRTPERRRKEVYC